MKAKILINTLLDFIFPVHCLGCFSFMPSASPTPYFCQSCLRNIKLVTHGQCGFCSKLSHEGKTCPECQDSHELDFVWAATRYEHSLIRKALWAYKYKFISSLWRALSELLLRFLKEHNKEQFFNTYREQLLVIPVPLHSYRLRWRSYNQSELLAKAIAQQFKLKLETKKLRRSKNRQPQIEIRDPQNRAENATNIFICPKSKTLQNKTVILVDDVSTTGSTLDSCAKVLKQAGVAKVIGLVVAKG